MYDWLTERFTSSETVGLIGRSYISTCICTHVHILGHPSPPAAGAAGAAAAEHVNMYPIYSGRVGGYIHANVVVNHLTVKSKSLSIQHPFCDKNFHLRDPVVHGIKI